MPEQVREQRERDTHTHRGKWSEREEKQAGREIRRNGEKYQQEAFYLKRKGLNIVLLSAETRVLSFTTVERNRKKEKNCIRRFSTRSLKNGQDLVDRQESASHTRADVAGGHQHGTNELAMMGLQEVTDPVICDIDRLEGREECESAFGQPLEGLLHEMPQIQTTNALHVSPR